MPFQETDVSAVQIAGHILYKESFEDSEVYKYDAFALYQDHKALQKKLYFGQVLALHYYNTELFHEDMQAWRDGPVQSDVYNLFKYDRGTLLTNINSSLGKFQSSIIDIIYEITKNLSPDQLVEISHERDGAWNKEYTGKKYVVIPKLLIANNIPSGLLKLIDEYFASCRKYDENLVSKDILNFELTK